MTEEKIREYFEEVDKNIKKYGYNVTNVFASEETPSFCYSTGIYRNFKIPELFISSLPPGLCAELIENYVKSFKDNPSIPLNVKLDDLSHRFSVYLIEVPISKLSNYVLTSIQFYNREEYKYLQVIFPDTKGHFPNDIGYDYDQEIMATYDG